MEYPPRSDLVPPNFLSLIIDCIEGMMRSDSRSER